MLFQNVGKAAEGALKMYVSRLDMRALTDGQLLQSKDDFVKLPDGSETAVENEPDDCYPVSISGRWDE